jgi:hypothetical protein
MSQPNLEFYSNLIDSMNRNVATLNSTLAKERGEKAEALSRIAELELANQNQAIVIASLQNQLEAAERGDTTIDASALADLESRITALNDKITQAIGGENPEPEQKAEQEDAPVLLERPKLPDQTPQDLESSPKLAP